jgi:hypothetical protein
LELEKAGADARAAFACRIRSVGFSWDALKEPDPGVSDPPANLSAPLSNSRHRLDHFRSVHAKEILGGLRHEYSLVRALRESANLRCPDRELCRTGGRHLTDFSNIKIALAGFKE